ncbi:MAG: hypothetical protein LBB58_00200 [Cellulomonadaceae bacterium]|jgi:hypothetical protein|nr:hypothetical protein [Cellulomonadaceae bacterium]
MKPIFGKIGWYIALLASYVTLVAGMWYLNFSSRDFEELPYVATDMYLTALITAVFLFQIGMFLSWHISKVWMNLDDRTLRKYANASVALIIASCVITGIAIWDGAGRYGAEPLVNLPFIGAIATIVVCFIWRNRIIAKYSELD